MKTIIAGSRHYENREEFLKLVAEIPWEVTEVVCGMCNGVDMLGWHWAEDNGIPVKEFPAEWKKYHLAAGPIRNKQMAEYADALFALKTVESKGTANMVKQAEKFRLKILVRKIG